MIRRYPLRAFLGGLLIGLGLAILLVIYGAAPLGSGTVLVVVLLFAAIGTAAAWTLPRRSRPVVVETTTTRRRRRIRIGPEALASPSAPPRNGRLISP